MNKSIFLTILASLVISGCDTLSERYERVRQGTEPDRPDETVPAPPGLENAPDPVPRVVVLSFPGLDSLLVERGMREGWLPNFRRLRIAGTYSRLLSESVPSRAGADATFLAGVGPAKHGILGDVRRVVVDGTVRTAPSPWQVVTIPTADRYPRGIPESYPAQIPVIQSRLEVPTLFNQLGQHGKKSLVLRSAVGFPGLRADGLDVLGAGCIPDLSLGSGPYTFVREREGDPETEITEEGGILISTGPSSGTDIDDVFMVPVFGPPEFKGGGGNLKTTVTVRVSKDRARATVITSMEKVELRAGIWSKSVPLFFEVASGLEISGRSRFYIRPTGLPTLELYVEPPDFDPVRPPPWQPVCRPPDLGRRLQAEYFELPRLSSSFPYAAYADGVLTARDAAAVLETSFKAEKKIFEGEVVQGEYDFLYQTFPLMEEVALLGEGVAEEVLFFGRRVSRNRLQEAAVVALDGVLGSAMSVATSPREDSHLTVLVFAPYGTGPTERFVDLNRFLLERGDLVTTTYVPPGIHGVPTEKIDIASSRAYALGNGQIFLNVEGRDPEGVLPESQVAFYITNLRLSLDMIRDPATGGKVITSVWQRDQFDRGGHQPDFPDLVAGFGAGYAVDREVGMLQHMGPLLSSAMGGSGAIGSATDPNVASGFVGITRRDSLSELPRLIDLAPTILAYLDLPIPEGWEGSALSQGDSMERRSEEEHSKEERESEIPNPLDYFSGDED